MPVKISVSSIQFLKKFVNGTWTIDNNSVFIEGDLDCSGSLSPDQTSLPRLNIERISGNFNCSNNNLESLINSPKNVGGSFRCSSNKLTSLKYSPAFVGLNFDCMYNMLEDLIGCPNEIPGNFIAGFNELKSLKNGPINVGEDYRVSTNKLESLEGSPENIGGSFQCENNSLTTLEGGPKKVGRSYDCSENKLESLLGSPAEINGRFICSNNQLATLENGPVVVHGDFICHSNLLSDLSGCPKVKSGLNCSSNKIISLDGLPVMNFENLVLTSNPISEKTLLMLSKDVCTGVPFSVSLALSWDLIDYRDQENLSCFLDFIKVSDYIFSTFHNDPVETTKIYDRLPVHIKNKVIKEISKRRKDSGAFERSIENISDLMQAGIFDDI